MAFQSPALQAAHEVTEALDYLSRAVDALEAAYPENERPEVITRLLSRIATQRTNTADLARELRAHGNMRPPRRY